MCLSVVCVYVVLPGGGGLLTGSVLNVCQRVFCARALRLDGGRCCLSGCPCSGAAFPASKERKPGRKMLCCIDASCPSEWAILLNLPVRVGGSL